MRAKEHKKVEKHQDLVREIRKMWGIRTKVIPIAVAALGTIPLRLKEILRTMGVNTCIHSTDSEMCPFGVSKDR